MVGFFAGVSVAFLAPLSARPGRAAGQAWDTVFLAYTLATLAISWFAWKLLEMPAQAWLNSLRRKRPQAGATSGVKRGG